VTELSIVRPPIELEIETRPSALEGHSWYLVLRYGSWHADALLPQEFPSMTEDERALVIAGPAARLKEQLRPILLAEDGPECPSCRGAMVLVSGGPVGDDTHWQCRACDSTVIAEDGE
jgi:hypothetical protein